jgi:hypothetical protein
MRLGPRVVGKYRFAPIGGRKMHVEEQHGGELLAEFSRGEAERMLLVQLLQSDVQAVGHEKVCPTRRARRSPMQTQIFAAKAADKIVKTCARCETPARSEVPAHHSLYRASACCLLDELHPEARIGAIL